MAVAPAVSKSVEERKIPARVAELTADNRPVAELTADNRPVAEPMADNRPVAEPMADNRLVAEPMGVVAAAGNSLG